MGNSDGFWAWDWNLSHHPQVDVYYWHPHRRLSCKDMWDDVNSIDNCMTMDSACHAIHDNRLLAIHHVRLTQTENFSSCWLLKVTYKIRLFAPVPALIMQNDQKSLFSQTSPGEEILHCHYKLTMMENMCARFLDKKGGAKRMQWNSLFPPEAVEQHEW